MGAAGPRRAYRRGTVVNTWRSNHCSGTSCAIWSSWVALMLQLIGPAISVIDRGRQG